RVLAEQDVRARFAQGARRVPAPAVPPARTRLLALSGGAARRSEDADKQPPKPTPKPAPAERPDPAAPKR
ncbi:hypothetical protein GTW63_12440, partial [Streptomyces sp. SID6137]|nr:hypothetical protein [Streptomyces sp. SID6137]